MEFWLWGSGYRVSGTDLRLRACGCREEGVGFRVQNLEP